MYTIVHIKLYANQKINVKFLYFLKDIKKPSRYIRDGFLKKIGCY